jgi:uncharacterized membrane protein
MTKKELVFGVSLIALLAVAIGVASANPGISVDVTPVKAEVLSDETAIYNVSVYCFAGFTEHVLLAISNPTSDWTYTFDPDEFDINDGETVYSNLTMAVPTGASPGEYYHDVNATASFMGWEVEKTTYTNVLTTVIPEFATIALPVAAIFGLLLLIRRRKEQN